MIVLFWTPEIKLKKTLKKFKKPIDKWIQIVYNIIRCRAIAQQYARVAELADAHV